MVESAAMGLCGALVRVRTRAAAALRGPARRSFIAGMCLLAASLVVAWSALMPPPASADPEPLTLLVRVEGPADKATFGTTGEYATVWSGMVEVPREVTITASSGKQYRLYVENGAYKATRLSDGQTWTLGEADDALGATSVLAALHQASIDGGFSYQLTDIFFPGMGFFVTAIGGVQGSGSVGWSYRVWNDTEPASPQVSIDHFLLGYDDAGVALPHQEVLFYWGSGRKCLPLRATPLDESVRCGLPGQVLVEAYVEETSGGGYWRPAEGASVCVNGECRTADRAGIAELSFTQEGTYAVGARKGYDGEYYYVPASDRSTIEVTGPCEVISVTVIDHGTLGVNFGYVVPGSTAAPERDQTTEHGAVTVVVGEETTINCAVQLRAAGELAGHAATLPLSVIAWGLDPSGAGAAGMSSDYATVGTAPAGAASSFDIWHWLTVPAEQPYGVYTGTFYYRATAVEP